MLDVMEKRRACRKFDSCPVEKEKIDEIIQAGLLAPSGIGRQTSAIIAISNKETRDKLMKLNAKIGGRIFHGIIDPFYGAPVILLVIAKKDGLSVRMYQNSPKRPHR